MQRIKEYIESCRMIWKREEKFEYHGQTVDVPLPAGEGTGLGKPLKLINHPVRNDIPIWWASLKGLSVEATAELADGWLPIFFIPERFQQVWGNAAARPAPPSATRAASRCEISAGGMLAIGEDLVGDKQQKDPRHGPPAAPRCTSAAWAPAARTSTTTSAATTATRRRPSRSRTCTSRARRTRRPRRSRPSGSSGQHLVGPKSYIKERVGAFKEAGVTVLSVNPVGPDAVEQIETLREIVDGAEVIEPGLGGRAGGLRGQLRQR